MVSLIDSLYKLSGLSKKKKMEQGDELVATFGFLNSWLDDHEFGVSMIKNTQGTEKLFDAIGLSGKILVRLGKRLDINYSETTMDDALLLNRAAVTLNFALICMVNLSPNIEGIQKYPILANLASLSTTVLDQELDEALNITRQLSKKYPY